MPIISISIPVDLMLKFKIMAKESGLGEDAPAVRKWIIYLVRQAMIRYNVQKATVQASQILVQAEANSNAEADTIT